MSMLRRLIAMMASLAIVLTTLVVAPSNAFALPPQPTTTVPPIIGNTASGILRDVPTAYYAAIDAFEDQAVQDVLDTHSLPAGDANAVRAWGRDAVRSQEFLNLLAIIKKPAASRTANEALVHTWFRELYQEQLVDQSQTAVDQYLEWSGLTMDTISLDPIPRLPGGGGYCDFRPPEALKGGTGAFGGVYNPDQLPQCQQVTGLEQCTQLPTGCPVPWPSIEQFEQWGRYLSQQTFFENPVLPNLAMDTAVGVGLAATMVATGIATAASRAYLAVPVAATSGTLFTKVFPWAARTVFKATADMTAQAAKLAAEAAKTAARSSAGIVRAGATAFVVGTVITAIITIGLESWTIYEHAQIPIKLKAALNVAKTTDPDLAAIADKSSGVGALMSTFVSTTGIDVDYDCGLFTESNGYSAFPCANAPTPPAPTATEDRLYISRSVAGVVSGGFEDSIYVVNPVDSAGTVTANENLRPSGHGWFVATKYNGGLAENRTAPTTPGATLQMLRAYYTDWDGHGQVAERIVFEGRPMFAISSLESADLGGCSTTPTAGAISTCVTDTIRYVEPDGTKASARIVAHDATGPTVNAVVPSRIVAGQPFALSASATATFGTGPFSYHWNVTGQAYDGPAVTATASMAGGIVISLDVTDAQGNTTRQQFPVLSAQATAISVFIWPAGTATYGSEPQVWAHLQPVTTQGVQCNWNPTSTEVGCLSPTGVIQYFLDGQPLGDPVRVTGRDPSPCPWGVGGCPPFVFGFNRAYGPVIALPAISVPPGTALKVTAVYYGDDKFVGSSSLPLTVEVDKAIPTVALTSGVTYPSPTEPVTLTASVLSTSTAAGVPTGTVQFLEGSTLTPLGNAVPVDSGGTATKPGVTLQYVNSLVVRYLGDANFAQTDTAVTPIRFPRATSVVVDPATSTVVAGADVALSITVKDEIGEPMPGADVVVSPGGLTATANAAGVATVTVTSPTIGDVTYSVAAEGIAGLGSATVSYGSVPSRDDSVADGEVGVPFSVTVAATGTPSPTISVAGLPAGLTFDASTGLVTGTPTTAGQSVATVKATSVLGSATSDLTLTIHARVAITTTAVPGATATLAYQAQLSAVEGLAPFEWSAVGLPPGLSLDAASGLISGIPTTDGTAHLEISVTDALGGTDDLDLDLVVAPRPRPDLATTLAASQMLIGASATYNATVTNSGNADAAGPLVVTTALASGLTYLRATTSGWTCAPTRQLVRCTRSAGLAAGAVATLAFEVRVAAKPGSVTSTATAATAPLEIVTTNNDASLTSVVTAYPRR